MEFRRSESHRKASPKCKQSGLRNQLELYRYGHCFIMRPTFNLGARVTERNMGGEGRWKTALTMSYANDALLQSQQCATVLHGHCKRGNLLVITVVAKTLPQQQPFQNRLSTAFNRDSITINKHTATGQTIRMNVRCLRIHAHTRIPSVKEISLPSTAFSLSFSVATGLSISSIRISGSISCNNCATTVLFCRPVFGGTKFNRCVPIITALTLVVSPLWAWTFSE